MAGSAVDAYYGVQPVHERMISALREAGVTAPTPDDLASMDHFHNAGVRATDALAALAEITAHDRVLDVGSGMAGPARWLMVHRGCAVVCVDATREFCESARALNALTGVQPEIHNADALDLAFADASFDVAWAQNAFMNIPDKARLLAGLHRVLKPGGRLVFQEVMQGPGGDAVYPVPWAGGPELSFLVTPDGYRRLIEEAGFTVRVWEDRTSWPATLPPLPDAPGLEVWVPDIETKVGNLRTNMGEGRTLLWWVLAER